MKKMLQNLIHLNHKYKKILMMFVDSFFVIIVLIASFSLRFSEFFIPVNKLFWLVLVSPLIAIPVFYFFDLYRSIIRFIGFSELWNIVKAATVYAFIWGLLALLIMFPEPVSYLKLPRSVILLNWFLATFTLAGIRIFARYLLTDIVATSKINVVIYGAGASGIDLHASLIKSKSYHVLYFIDDSSRIQGRSINGVDVISFIKFKKLIKIKNIQEVLLAMPSSSRSRSKEIMSILTPLSLIVKSLPSLHELLEGKVSINDLREIKIKDLLGRPITPSDEFQLTSDNIGNVVMVTGAGGSIGSEICRQIASLKPDILILYEHNEFSLYSIFEELKYDFKDALKVLPILGSVTNTTRLQNVLKEFKVQTIYHAAAYKHVPMVEYNHIEGAENNIIGTLSCAEAANEANVNTFVLISTDKAVRPTNTMGATKRFAELILQSFSSRGSNTKFIAVRFGNVLGSSGSVIPLFEKQIKGGGPLTITDPKMERFFMTISEAVELVIQAGTIGKGGEIFILNMGEPVSILELAKKMINLSGLQIKDSKNPYGDIEIQYTGLRPGEKLFEELLISNSSMPTSHPMIINAIEEFISWNELEPLLDELKVVIKNYNHERLRQLLCQAVPHFNPQSHISDVLYKSNNK